MTRRIILAVALFLVCTDAYPQSSPPPPALPTNNGSGVIAVGGTFQQILPAVPVNSFARRSLTIQNNNTGTDACWLHIGTGIPSLANSILLPAPAGSYVRYYPYVPSDAMQITCTSTNDTFYVDTQ